MSSHYLINAMDNKTKHDCPQSIKEYKGCILCIQVLGLTASTLEEGPIDKAGSQANAIN